MSAPRSVVIHGHFYQPPREDPWLDEVEAEPSAAPFHDWNQRIERECYRAVVAARIPGTEGRIARIVNALEWISFNFGPTLLEWLQREAPDTYAAILEADARSAARLGFGNAIAMPYHHAILPLSSRRDKITEVRWGIADFRRRFGREPMGMWLPETAVDHETLEVLAVEGIRFTILAPHQVARPPAMGWPGRYRAGGWEIAVFVYDGTLSHEVAFGPLIRDAAAWAQRLAPPPPPPAPHGTDTDPQLVSVATDGETYGHHRRFGEMALAAVLDGLSRRGDVKVENFAAFLARHPPRDHVELVEPSSWSCPHGVARWRSDCGCRVAREVSTHQRWRAPLRDALGWLARRLHEVFEREGAALLREPWAVRDAYGAVVGLDQGDLEGFADQWMTRSAAGDDLVRTRELLEMERNALRMFTSCGWFFDDIAGIEARQVLRYAARAIDLAGSARDELETGLLEHLARAESNDATIGNGANLYRRQVKPRVAAAARVAAGYAALTRLAPEARDACLRGYTVRQADGLLTATHCRTGRAHAFSATVEWPSLARFEVQVSEAGGHRVALGLNDLPESARQPVARALLAAVRDRWFTDREREALASGTAVAVVAVQALLRAVEALGKEPLLEADAQVLDLADLLELLGEPVPFDAQTRLYRLRESLPPYRAAALAPVARRLGFV